MIRIRTAGAGDVKTLQRLNSEVFQDNVAYDPTLDLNWSLSAEGAAYYSAAVADEAGVCLVAEDGDVPVGYICAGPKRDIGRTVNFLEINDMGVTPAYRSKGIGRMLIDECMSRAKARGFERISLRVYFNNTKAIEFYKKAGLTEIEVGMEKVL